MGGKKGVSALFLILSFILVVSLVTVVKATPGTLVENVRVDNTLITTAGPTLRLRLSSDSGFIVFEDQVRIENRAQPHTRLDLAVRGRVGIGIGAPTENLEIFGNIRLGQAGGSIYGEGLTIGAGAHTLISFRGPSELWVRNPVIRGRLSAPTLAEQAMLTRWEVSRGGDAHYARLGPLIIQWGRVRSGRESEGGFSVTFPRSFGSVPRVVVTMDSTEHPPLAQRDYWVQVFNVSTSGFSVYLQHDGDGIPGTWNTFVYWLATGT